MPSGQTHLRSEHPGSVALTCVAGFRKLVLRRLGVVPVTQEQLREAIRQRAAGGKVSCKAMLELAAETETPPKEIGRLCDELSIKITACQLGCFR